MPFDSRQEHYLQLRNLIVGPRRANIVPFVGAGLSLYGPPQYRLPRWGELVERIVDRAERQGVLDDRQVQEIRAHRQSGRNIEALGKLYTHAGQQWVAQAVEAILEIRADGISPAAVALMAISWTIIVTTNLDRMLELAYDKLVNEEKLPNRQLHVLTSRDKGEFLDSMSIEHAARVILAKIHGSVEDYRSFVLTTQEYDTLLGSGLYRYILQDLFRKNLFIVGFSLNDPDFDWAIDHIAGNFHDKNYPPYVVLPDDVFRLPKSHPYLQRIEHLQRFNDLRVITYRVDRGAPADDVWSGHRELFECLSDLRNSWFEAYSAFRRHGGSLANERHFVGRRMDLRKIDRLVFDENIPCQIRGFGGEGKTTLVSYWLESRLERLKGMGLKDAFIFNCYSNSPAQFFAQASQHLSSVPPGLGTVEQKNEILSFAQLHKTLFIFDGFEVFQDVAQDGAVRDQLLKDFLEEIVVAGAAIILTTRLAVPGFGDVVSLGPLNDDDIDELITTTLPLEAHPATIKRAVDRLGGHAQSLRLVLYRSSFHPTLHDAAYLPAPSAPATLTYNKAIAALEAVRRSLTRDDDTVLQIASIFQRPFTLEPIRRLIALKIDGFTVSFDPDSKLLPPLIGELIDRQLMISNDGPATYTLHPNVRDFYHMSSGDHKALHRAYVEILLDAKPESRIQSFAEADFYFSVAYHAARAGNWSLFDYYYQHVLMRGQEDYVCDTLGLWSETLDLTRYVFPDLTPRTRAYINPAYYSSRYARSLKHLGHGRDATKAYDACLYYCAEERFPKTAIYLNNDLTLQIYMGNLAKARRMAAWNFASFQWIDSENGARNQMEHGGYSIGWLAMLLGDFRSASKLFDLAVNAWKGAESQKSSFFQYYPVYFSEMHLIESGSNFAADKIIDDQLAQAQKHGWRETEARCHIFASLAQRHRSRQFASKQSMLHLAEIHCKHAEDTLRKILAPPVEIELLGELLCVFFEDPDNAGFEHNPTRLLQRFDRRVSSLEWNLYRPDQQAFLGLDFALKGDRQRALRYLEEAEKHANAQGNVFALLSPYRPIAMLRERLGEPILWTFDDFSGAEEAMTRTLFDPIIGADLVRAINDDFISQPTSSDVG